ncbi:Serine/threonine protein kinase KIN1 [Smittium mucronatum]|uniref:Serine/threonine protein kinase KIN1 n=1 Tax=Smittium mucronatum TaxID=133383 RepID=A0A1R0GM54_9FUNG|nr:Serine/threonine protein kinase KIN1 [Smittium mucronatum]
MDISVAVQKNNYKNDFNNDYLPMMNRASRGTIPSMSPGNNLRFSKLYPPNLNQFSPNDDFSSDSNTVSQKAHITIQNQDENSNQYSKVFSSMKTDFSLDIPEIPKSIQSLRADLKTDNNDKKDLNTHTKMAFPDVLDKRLSHCSGSSDERRKFKNNSSFISRSYEQIKNNSNMIGPFKFKKVIGEGNMGKVFLGLDTRNNALVAIKSVPRVDPNFKVSNPVYKNYALNPSGQSDLDMQDNQEISTPDGDPKNMSLGAKNFIKFLKERPNHEPISTKPPRSLLTTKQRESSESKDIRALREIAISQILYHPNICETFDTIVSPHHFYLISEVVSGGQLLDYILKKGRLNESHARKFARQILSAINYMHENNIVHRDLKIENILITNKGNIKIIDFGLSNVYSNSEHLHTYCGSLYFAAPELLNSNPYTGPEVDIWSFGVVLYVLVTGSVPFDDQNMSKLYMKIKIGKFFIPPFLTNDCAHLLTRLIKVNPKHRAKISEILEHRWISKKGSLDPPIYTPKRVPLVHHSQIDSRVVEIMSKYIGLGLGSKNYIYQSIVSKITSEEYREFLKTKYKKYLDSYDVNNDTDLSDVSKFVNSMTALDVWKDKTPKDISIPTNLNEVSYHDLFLGPNFLPHYNYPDSQQTIKNKLSNPEYNQDSLKNQELNSFPPQIPSKNGADAVKSITSSVLSDPLLNVYYLVSESLSRKAASLERCLIAKQKSEFPKEQSGVYNDYDSIFKGLSSSNIMNSHKISEKSSDNTIYNSLSVTRISSHDQSKKDQTVSKAQNKTIKDDPPKGVQNDLGKFTSLPLKSVAQPGTLPISDRVEIIGADTNDYDFNKFGTFDSKFNVTEGSKNSRSTITGNSVHLTEHLKNCLDSFNQKFDEYSDPFDYKNSFKSYGPNNSPDKGTCKANGLASPDPRVKLELLSSRMSHKILSKIESKPSNNLNKKTIKISRSSIPRTSQSSSNSILSTGSIKTNSSLFNTIPRINPETKDKSAPILPKFTFKENIDGSKGPNSEKLKMKEIPIKNGIKYFPDNFKPHESIANRKNSNTLKSCDFKSNQNSKTKNMPEFVTSSNNFSVKSKGVFRRIVSESHNSYKKLSRASSMIFSIEKQNVINPNQTLEISEKGFNSIFKSVSIKKVYSLPVITFKSSLKIRELFIKSFNRLGIDFTEGPGYFYCNLTGNGREHFLSEHLNFGELNSLEYDEFSEIKTSENSFSLGLVTSRDDRYPRDLGLTEIGVRPSPVIRSTTTKPGIEPNAAQYSESFSNLAHQNQNSRRLITFYVYLYKSKFLKIKGVDFKLNVGRQDLYRKLVDVIIKDTCL